MDRRGFLARAGLLLGSVGVAEAFKQDLMAKIGKAALSEAEAQSGAPRRQLEICFRAGIPMMIFGTGEEFSRLETPAYSNFSYAGSEVLRSPSAPTLYLNADSQPLMRHSGNLAITQGVAVEGGHTNMFNYREGGMGKGKTTPIVELANANATGSLVQGVKWPGDAVNSVASGRDLIRVESGAGFMNLFKNPRLRFTAAEVQTILASAQAVSRRQAVLLDGKLKDSLTQFESHRKAALMFGTDASARLSTQGMASELTSTDGRAGVREAFAKSLKAFQHNLVNSAMIVVELGDWHGFQTNKQNADIIADVSGIIAAAVDFLKATDEPAAPGLKLWDTTLVVAGSEFTRGVAKFEVDNSDGGTQGLMLLGKNVKGGYYGGFTLPSGATQMYGEAHGFNKETGATLVGQKNTAEELYCTIRAASGLPLSTTEREKVMSCMVTG